MARPTSKKVTRAAQTGGGRTNRGTRPVLYWAFIIIVVVLGVAGVAQSRDERRDELASADTLTPPRANEDHWHAAYAIYICDRFIAPFTDQRDPEGIHTHGDGVIHIHPLVRRAAGKNATLSKFFDALRVDMSDTEIEIPGDQTYREGEDECKGKPGVVQLKVKGRQDVVTTDIPEFRFTEDRLVLTLAFVAEGTDIPPPPSEPNLDNLSDVGPTETSIVPPPGSTPDSTAPGDPSATTTPTETTAPPATTAP